MLGRVPGDAERPSGSAAAAAGSGGATAQACPEIDDTDQLKGKKNLKICWIKLNFEFVLRTSFKLLSANMHNLVTTQIERSC